MKEELSIWFISSGNIENEMEFLTEGKHEIEDQE